MHIFEHIDSLIKENKELKEYVEYYKERWLSAKKRTNQLLDRAFEAERKLEQIPEPGSPEAMKPLWEIVKLIEEECGLSEEAQFHSSIERIIRTTIRTALQKAYQNGLKRGKNG